MDPLSVLGATAASSQLVSQASSLIKFLWDVYSQIKDDELIRKQIIQIQQLVDLSRSFLVNPSLQTDSVASVLGTCLLRAQEFQRLLKNVAIVDGDGKLKKLKKAFDLVMKEKEMQQLLGNLEREKTLLILSIEVIDVNLLHDLGLSITEIQTGVESMSIGIKDTANDVTAIVEKLPVIDDIHKNMTTLLSKLELNAQPPTPKSPATQKKGFFLVQRPVKDFVGREEILKQITSTFAEEFEDEPKIVVIRGLGGQGKTQICLEYCRRAKKAGVKAIFWVDAMTEANVKEAFIKICDMIKDPNQDFPNEDSRIAFVLEELESWTEKWIMVFDNHDDPEAFDLQKYIPQGGYGCLLVTSRHAETKDLALEHAIDLPGLPPDDAVKLLLKGSHKPATEQNVQAAHQIVERFGCHALAVAQAASYVHKRRMELSEFMDHYQKQQKEILSQHPQMSQYRRQLDDETSETVLSVFTTWEMSFRLLEKREQSSNLETSMLTLFAFFDSKDISEELFKVYCTEYQPVPDSQFVDEKMLHHFWSRQNTWDPDLFAHVLVTLEELSLIQGWFADSEGDHHLSLHPLIKDWIRLRTKSEAFTDYSIAAAYILCVFLSTNYQQGHFKMSLLKKLAISPHLTAHRENVQSLMSHPSLDFNTLYHDLHLSDHWIATFLRESGEFREAKEILRRVAAWHESKLGVENESTLASLDTLAGVLDDVGEHEEAECIYRRTLEIKERLLGPENPQTLATTNNLALLLSRMGQYEEAEKLHRSVLEIRMRVSGPEHPHTLTITNNLASLLSRMGQYEEAEKLHRSELEITMRVSGPEHPGTLQSQNNLAAVLSHLGKNREAEDLWRRTLAAQERVSGETHPDTLSVLNNLGSWVKSEDMLLRALKGREKLLGLLHPHTLRTINMLGDVCRDTGQREKALGYFERGLVGRERVLGKNHRETLTTVHNLGSLYHDMGQHDKALEYLQRALRGTEGTLGKDHKDTLTTVHRMGTLYHGMGEYDKALEYLHRALPGREKTLGKDHENTLNTIYELGVVYSKLEEHDKALDYLQRALLGREGTLGKDHKDTLPTVYKLGLVYQEIGEYDKALEHLQRTLRGEEETLGETDQETLYTIWDLADVYRDMGNYQKASESFQRACSGFEKTLGMDDPDTVACMRQYEQFLEEAKEAGAIDDLEIEDESEWETDEEENSEDATEENLIIATPIATQNRDIEISTLQSLPSPPTTDPSLVQITEY